MHVFRKIYSTSRLDVFIHLMWLLRKGQGNAFKRRSLSTLVPTTGTIGVLSSEASLS